MGFRERVHGDQEAYVRRIMVNEFWFDLDDWLLAGGRSPCGRWTGTHGVHPADFGPRGLDADGSALTRPGRPESRHLRDWGRDG